jgi:hypothetical protein
MTGPSQLAATTAGGLPYPAPTDPAKAGADNIKALADALESRGHGKLVQSGSLPATTDGAGNASITFPAAFKATTVPIVLLGLNINSVVAVASMDPARTDNTKVGFLPVGLWPTDKLGQLLLNTSITVFYIAVGVAP